MTPKIRPASDDQRGAAEGASLLEGDDPGGAQDERRGPEHGDDRERDRDQLAARDVDRLARDQALELAAGDERAGERDRADERAEDDEDRRVERARPSSSRMKSSMATRAAAPPPTALNSDTSCGIAVIFTVRAVYRPAPPPIRNPTTMIDQRRRRSGRLHG